MTQIHDERQMPHPLLIEARQIASNQILLTYDQNTDLGSATNISNYWIRSNMGAGGIASADMTEGLTRANALSPNMGMVTPVSNSKRRFVMTFRMNAVSGVMYTVLPCYVNLEGRTGFMGENWGPLSRNMFFGM